MKKQSTFFKIFWKITISIIGIALILISIVNLLLFFFGESTTAHVTTRRVGGANNNYSANQRYEWSLDYTFEDKGGKTHSGHTTRRGNDMSAKVDGRVYYFPFASFISSLESEAKPNIGQPMLIAIGLFLLFVMNKKKSDQ